MNRKGSRIAPRKVGQFDGTHIGHNAAARTALLNCRHAQEFRPSPEINDEVYCQKCKDYRIVLVLQADYRARCRSCKYSRPFGRAMFAADSAARKHGDKTGHTVDRYDGTNLEWSYTPGGPEQLTIEQAEEPPF